MMISACHWMPFLGIRTTLNGLLSSAENLQTTRQQGLGFWLKANAKASVFKAEAINFVLKTNAKA